MQWPQIYLFKQSLQVHRNEALHDVLEHTVIFYNNLLTLDHLNLIKKNVKIKKSKSKIRNSHDPDRLVPEKRTTATPVFLGRTEIEQKRSGFTKLINVSTPSACDKTRQPLRSIPCR